MRESGSKRANSHTGSNLANSLSHIDKLQSAFMMGTGGRERGGGDETSSNVKSYRNDEVANLSDKKSIANSRATQSYLSNRLSRQRGGGRSINTGTLPDPVTGGV